MADNPLDQFIIKPLVDLSIGGSGSAELTHSHLSFSNSTLYMCLTVLVVVAFLTLGVRRASLVPNRMQSVSEILFEFVSSMLRDTAGSGGRKYFPMIFIFRSFLNYCIIFLSESMLV